MAKNTGVNTGNRVDIRTISAAQTRELRALILRPDQSPEMMAFPGDDAPDALHLGAFDQKYLVGIVTILHQAPGDYTDTDRDRLWLLRGMATMPHVRGHGYGAALVRSGCAHVARQNGIYVWCVARESAVGFYEKAGFVIRGNRFDMPFTGPHYRMWREITAADTAYGS